MNIFDQITSPTLLLDKNRCLNNIQRMVEKAQRSGIHFRPHFKTHQSAIIGDWFRDFGVSTITVSSVKMAQYFTDHGWKDITIAFPVNLREIVALNNLASKIHLELLVESNESIHFLTEKLQSPVDIWIKADVGANRTGLQVGKPTAFISLAKEISKSQQLKLKGVLTHAGQTYHCGSADMVRQIFKDAVLKLVEVKEKLHQVGYNPIQISWGDTPSCCLVNDLSAVDEIRPGNFVLFDYTQYKIGSCDEIDIAAAVACPVVALHPERNEVVIHGGAIHLSKERMEEDGKVIYGAVALPTSSGWSKQIPGAYVNSISQEHGILYVPDKYINKMKIGELVIILPVHSCLTVDLFDNYLSLDGELIPTINNAARWNPVQ